MNCLHGAWRYDIISFRASTRRVVISHLSSGGILSLEGYTLVTSPPLSSLFFQSPATPGMRRPEIAVISRFQQPSHNPRKLRVFKYSFHSIFSIQSLENPSWGVEETRRGGRGGTQKTRHRITLLLEDICISWRQVDGVRWIEEWIFQFSGRPYQGVEIFR